MDFSKLDRLPGFPALPLLPLSLHFHIRQMRIIAVPPPSWKRYGKGAWSSAGHSVGALPLLTAMGVSTPIVGVVIRRLQGEESCLPMSGEVVSTAQRGRQAGQTEPLPIPSNDIHTVSHLRYPRS